MKKGYRLELQPSLKILLSIIAMVKIQKQRTQLQNIFCFLKKNVATASQVSAATNVPHKNICRYKRDLEMAGLLAEIKKDKCPITGFKAWFITCDPSKFPNRKQLSLW